VEKPWRVIDNANGVDDGYATEEEALKAADELLQSYRDQARDDGEWDFDVTGIEVYLLAYGIKESKQQTDDGESFEYNLVAAEAIGFKAALEKFYAIRNSIVGTQTVNWSAHIYPLVAALNEAGFQGQGYEEARKEAQTLIEQRDNALALVETIRRVASGEDQVADDDTEGMAWIQRLIAEAVRP